MDCVLIPRVPGEIAVHGSEPRQDKVEEPSNPVPPSSSNTKPATRSSSKPHIPVTPSLVDSDSVSASDSESGDDYGAEGDRPRHIHATSSKSNHSFTDNISEEISDDLVETPAMKPHDFTYNSRYKLLICKQCSCGVTFKSVISHLTGQGRYYELKDGNWEHQNIVHRSGQKIDKNLMLNIARELRELGHHGFEEIQEPPTDQVAPVKGLHIFTKAQKCTKCNRCFIKRSTFRNHFGRDHSAGYSVPAHALTVSAQSFYMGGNSKALTLFPIESTGSGAPAPVIPDNTSLLKLSPVELMRRRKAGQLEHGGRIVKDALAQRVVLPYFQNSGIAAFLDKFEAEDLVNARILPRMTAKEAPQILLTLRSIVLKSFIQTCRQVAIATEAGRYPFGRADT